jgi:hypothetical protein
MGNCSICALLLFGYSFEEIKMLQQGIPLIAFFEEAWTYESTI